MDRPRRTLDSSVIARGDPYERRAPREGAGAGVVERLRARRSEIAEAILARVLEVAPAAAELGDPEYVAGVRAAVAAAIDFVLAGLGQRTESGPIPTAAVAQARRAARAGVGLDTMLRRYVAGHTVLQGFVVQETDLDEPLSHGLSEVLACMSVLLDRLITAVSDAYGEEVERAGVAVSAGKDGAAAQRRGARFDRTVSGGSGTAPRRALGMRRERILEAMVQVAAERGFENASVKLVTGRAGVSTRTFYEEFENLQDCFVAVLDLALERAGELIAQAFVREERWQDGVLGALASLLVFFDSAPLLTRVWFVEAMAAGSWALQRREQIAEGLRTMMVEYWAARGDEPPEPVATAGVMASVLGLIQTHLVTEQPGSLIELLGPLMGLVTSLHLDTQDRAREVERGTLLARAIQAGDPHWSLSTLAAPQSMDASDPTTPGEPSARRARECLLFLAEQGRRGRSPSNREVAVGIGVVHQSQISRLMACLVQEDLAIKRSQGAGKRNAWRLTARGEELAKALSDTASGSSMNV